MELQVFLSLALILLNVSKFRVTGIVFDYDILKWLEDNGPAEEVHPGHRSGSLTWQDGDTYWLFGGETYDETLGSVKLLNDLWKQEVGTRKWTQVHDASSKPTDEMPVPRQMGSACGVSGLYMVIFGGVGNQDQFLLDTWLYDFSNKKWVNYSGNHTDSNDSVVTPAARADAATWCTHDHMIIFSGAYEMGMLHNDMWFFSLQKFKWEDTSVSTEAGDNGRFTHLLSGFPQPRTGAVTWGFKYGGIYLFGGNTKQKEFHAHDGAGYMSDLWKYDMTTRRWAFIQGRSHSGPRQTSSVGTVGIPLSSNKPGCRHRAASWSDTGDGLWMFGGEGLVAPVESKNGGYPTQLLKDFWYFRLKVNQWIFVGGRTESGRSETVERLPPARILSLTFQEGNDFYLYGGKGADDRKKHGIRGDIWHVNENAIVYWPQHYSLGSVIGMVILAFSLVFVLVVTTLFARKKFLGLGVRFPRVQYSKLNQTIDP
ncbi:hypothetical protein ScPMuIL_014194 [Solemya velum]